MKKDTERKNWLSNRIGLVLFGIFYLVSCVMVFLHTSAEKVVDPELKTLTFAHWNLEDGFREGFNEAIRLFEELKAKEGQKVKIIQTTVPVRGYRQWMMTQLIGGSPADLMKYQGGSDLLNQYFHPLSEYISQPNPFNKGTPLQGVPWKDTFIDGMRNAMDPVYSEYYGVGTYFHTFRMFVNMDLLEKATGSRKLPANLREWLDICEKIKEYGIKVGKPVIPIGVRGFDKATLNFLFSYYLSQMGGNLNDTATLYCTAIASATDVTSAITNPELKKRLLASVDIIKEIGQYFGEGFTATDLEQTKFLFFAGMVGFFPEGTWNGYSMVKNSPFEVEVIPIPSLGKGHKYSKYFTGKLTEMGVGVGGNFAIPKATKHFDLALEFLQFITSYKINQLVMNECKWPPAVKQAKYEGLMRKFQPILDGYRLRVPTPFSSGNNTKRKMLECLEDIIIEDSPDAQQKFWKNYISRIPMLNTELKNSLTGDQRSFLELADYRTRTDLDLLRSNISKKERRKLALKESISFENYVERLRLMFEKERQIKELDKLKEQN